jgi:disulfide bond formation protein DsbB
VTRFNTARALALAVPLALMGGALGSQLFGGLYPCEMCHWQRWPHYTAIVIALLALGMRNRGVSAALVALAALAIITSGAIGVFHAGVENRWWDGITPCSITAVGTSIKDIMAAPLVRCDEAQWRLLGISLAGFNAIISVSAGLLILGLIAKPEKSL